MKRGHMVADTGLGARDLGLLEMAVAKPLQNLPPLHLSIARRLAERGLLAARDGVWYPTAAALTVLRHRLH